MRLRHPDPEALRDWLAGGGDENLDRHVGECSRCASLMEEIEEADLATDDELRLALSDALAPPVDLADRLIEGVNDRLSARQVVSLVADLFAAGFETSRMLLVEEDHDG